MAVACSMARLTVRPNDFCAGWVRNPPHPARKSGLRPSSRSQQIVRQRGDVARSQHQTQVARAEALLQEADDVVALREVGDGLLRMSVEDGVQHETSGDARTGRLAESKDVGEHELVGI